MRGEDSRGEKAIIILLLAVCVVVAALGGWLYFSRTTRTTTLELDDGVMACGFRGDPTVLPKDPEEITLRKPELTLLARGRVVFSGQAEELTCYRSHERRWDIPGGDYIQVELTAAPLEATVTRWRRIYQQLGAPPLELRLLDEWAATVTQTERAGHTRMAVWLQLSFSVPGTNIGVYTQSIPMNSEPPLIYGSHFTVFWKGPPAQP